MRIFDIGTLSEELYSQVGGKARGLDFLKKNGYNIADGFIVTDIDVIGDDEFEEILSKFDLLGAESVSVRSSASNEDGSTFSNAGQYETCLDVKREGLKGAIDRCLKSLCSDRAAAYSQNLLDGEAAKMNLVVERMIDASYAGVMFSTDPLSKDQVLIEAVSGKGELLVSGNSSAYRYSVPKIGFKIDTQDGLNQDTLGKIYYDGLQIAKAFGKEADLEWVVDNNGELYWLQIRPITTLDEADIDEFNPAHSLDNHLLTSRNIGEMMPGSITPLSISTSLLAIDYGMRNMLSKIGAIKSIDAKPNYYAALAVKYHLFIDMSALYILGQKVMLTSNDAMNLSIMGEHLDYFPEPEGKNAFFLVKFINGVKFAKYLFSSKKAKKRIVEIYEKLNFTSDKNEKEIYDEITNKLSAMNDALCCHYICSSFSGSMNSALYMMVSNCFADKAEYMNFISSLLSDIDGIESADILQSLQNLSKEILSYDCDALNYTYDELLGLVTDENNIKIHTLYCEFLAKHGHRSIKEAELRSKAWKNDPVALMKNLHTVMASGITEKDKKQFDIEEHLVGFKGFKKKSLRWIGNNARQAVRDREFSKSNIIKVIDKFKDRYALLAKILVDKGYLADEDSIYFLSHEEIGKLISGDASLKRKAISRRMTFLESEDMSFDDICIGTPKPIEVSGTEAIECLKGIPVCKGKVYGKARIVKTFDDALKIKKGEIMIAPFTDIGWSPYYSVIGALITEVGSTLSHGAVVAREYCLPTIVNVKNATKLIRDGDYLFVDASKGTVSIISEEEYLSKKR
ncbi:MAG: hypothetical protein J1F36_01405 [Clostridiales bacterium]|nr:hypothetical protein [Clostridiales bacterium]